MSGYRLGSIIKNGIDELLDVYTEKKIEEIDVLGWGLGEVEEKWKKEVDFGF